MADDINTESTRMVIYSPDTMSVADLNDRADTIEALPQSVSSLESSMINLMNEVAELKRALRMKDEIAQL